MSIDRIGYENYRRDLRQLLYGNWINSVVIDIIQAGTGWVVMFRSPPGTFGRLAVCCALVSLLATGLSNDAGRAACKVAMRFLENAWEGKQTGGEESLVRRSVPNPWHQVCKILNCFSTIFFVLSLICWFVTAI